MTNRRILYVQYANPAMYPPLEHSSRILADKGWMVMFLGIHALGSSDEIELPLHVNITVRKRRYCAPGLRQKLHYAAFICWAVMAALWWQPRWIYASDLLGCPVATILQILRFHVIYHEHDHPGHSVGAFQLLLTKVRARAARQADLVILPNEARAQILEKETGRTGPTVCVWNCPARLEALDRPQKAENELLVFYHGSVVPARIPPSVIRALAELPAQVRLVIAGYETVGHPDYMDFLSALAERLGLGDRVEYIGALSRAELLQRTRRAHVGLSLMPMSSPHFNEEAMTGASNKPFEYLACECALLVSDLPDWQKFFVQPGFARSCVPTDSASIAAALRWFLDNRSEMSRMAQAGRQRVLTDWNYEDQFAPVAAMIDGYSAPIRE